MGVGVSVGHPGVKFWLLKVLNEIQSFGRTSFHKVEWRYKLYKDRFTLPSSNSYLTGSVRRFLRVYGDFIKIYVLFGRRVPVTRMMV